MIYLHFSFFSRAVFHKLCEIIFIHKLDLAQTLPHILWHIFVNFMDKEPCTKFCGVFVRFKSYTVAKF